MVNSMAELWGKLHGVRPVKMAREMIQEGNSDEEIIRFFAERFQPSGEKMQLVLETARTEVKLLRDMYLDGISLYVSIPFCPSKCYYCSFTSYSAQKYDVYIEDYLSCLIKEMKHSGELLRKLQKRIETVYIGGGTPSILSEDYFERLLSAMERYFDLSAIREFSVECGRPDTITKEKLLVLKKHGIDRISINPQSMKDATLLKIGRNHTKEQFLAAFYAAREVGFKSINTDIIAGLEEESTKDFADTVNQILVLKPENITVHTLCLKRSAPLMEQKEKVLQSKADTENMLRYAYRALKDAGYAPYYLYRQKNMINHLENTGYSLPALENRYNIYTMEECQSILALGAGAATKIVTNDDIERIFNLKDPKEYIQRIGEMLDRKNKIPGLLQ